MEDIKRTQHLGPREFHCHQGAQLLRDGFSLQELIRPTLDGKARLKGVRLTHDPATLHLERRVVGDVDGRSGERLTVCRPPILDAPLGELRRVRPMQDLARCIKGRDRSEGLTAAQLDVLKPPLAASKGLNQRALQTAVAITSATLWVSTASHSSKGAEMFAYFKKCLLGPVLIATSFSSLGCGAKVEGLPHGIEESIQASSFAPSPDQTWSSPGGQFKQSAVSGGGVALHSRIPTVESRTPHTGSSAGMVQTNVEASSPFMAIPFSRSINPRRRRVGASQTGVGASSRVRITASW